MTVFLSAGCFSVFPGFVSLISLDAVSFLYFHDRYYLEFRPVFCVCQAVQTTDWGYCGRAAKSTSIAIIFDIDIAVNVLISHIRNRGQSGGNRLSTSG